MSPDAAPDRRARRKPARREPRGGAAAELLDRMIALDIASAAVGLIGSGERVLWSRAAGWARTRPAERAAVATRFDLGSLTKPMVATLALALDRQGALRLRLPLGDVWPRAASGLARQPLENLLRHRSGLRAWTPLFQRFARRRPTREDLLGVLLDPTVGSRGGRQVYSDLGYILWGFAAEAVTGRPLWSLLRRHVARPLGLRAVAPSPLAGSGLAMPAYGNAREVELAAAEGVGVARRPPPARGQAHDGNARFLGGLAGHAGLYGTARDLWRLGREWLHPEHVLDRGQIDYALSGGGDYALGWARRRVRGSAGPALSSAAFGHTGFPGGSLWIDPRRQRVLALLSHRRSPHSDLNAWRRHWHTVAVAAIP